MNEQADIALLLEALDLEREAVRRYVAHAAGTSDPRLVSYWESLRRNEAEHREALCAALRARGAEPPRDSDEPTDGERVPLPGPPARARGHARDLARLREDQTFEDQATKRYGQMAARAFDPEVKALFNELTRGEAGHRRGLRHVIDRVEDPAEPVIMFCPLCGWELDFGPDPLEGATAKCRMCPGRFALRLSRDGDWTLERLAP